jgi:lipopolysaccharide/colanic/teichoic acid biosynthesis glycosyltransferase
MTQLQPASAPHSADREPWPVIDRLTPDATIAVAFDPSWYDAAKILFDYAGAILLMPIAIPLIAAAAVAIWLTSPGPAFYTQTRVGLNGRRYKIIKLRTMHHKCELKSGIKWSSGKSDNRVTRLGKLLRASHIDELPQLFNVLAGHMSLIGPRPERPEVIQAQRLEQLVPGYSRRLLVKPGMTGLAQLQLPADSDVTSVRHKVVYDLYYMHNHGPLLDARILMATALKPLGFGPAVLRRLFWLPTRDKVAAEFCRNLSAEQPVFQLQTA